MYKCLQFIILIKEISRQDWTTYLLFQKHWQHFFSFSSYSKDKRFCLLISVFNSLFFFCLSPIFIIFLCVCINIILIVFGECNQYFNQHFSFQLRECTSFSILGPYYLLQKQNYYYNIVYNFFLKFSFRHENLLVDITVKIFF